MYIYIYIYILIFKYFPIIPSEMNSTPQKLQIFRYGLPKDFLSKSQKMRKKNVCTGCTKSAVRGCKQNILKTNFIGVSATKSWEKFKKIKVWVV